MPRLGLCLGVGMGGAKWSPLSIVGLTHLWDSPNWYTDIIGGPPATLATADGAAARQWLSPTGSLVVKSVTDANAPVYRPTGGAGNGASVQFTAATTAPYFTASGSDVIPATPPIAMIVVARNDGTTGRSVLAGRGPFNNNGFSIEFDSSNRIVANVRGATVLNGPVIAEGTTTVALLAYDGTTVYFTVHGASELSAAKTGDISFADNSFGIGAGGSSVGYAFQVGSKHIALVAVTRTIPDLAGRAALVANMAAYKGVS